MKIRKMMEFIEKQRAMTKKIVEFDVL